MVDPSLMEKIYLWISIALFVSFLTIRLIYRRKIKQKKITTKISKGGNYLFPLILVEVVMYILYTIDIIINPLSNFFQLSLPYWLRWIGVCMFASADVLFIWIHRHLGSNFFSTLKLRNNHELIITGPYKRTRHPMYSAFYLWHIGMFLISANWLIGVSWISGLTFIVAFRVKKEEDMMIEYFGSEYENYMKRTYRFFPKFFRF